MGIIFNVSCKDMVIKKVEDKLKELDIDIEKFKSTCYLDLSNKGLDSFPEWIRPLSICIVGLNLSGNKVGRIPEWIIEFQKLKELILENCGFIQMPKSIYHLRDLEYYCLNKSVVSLYDVDMCCVTDECSKADNVSILSTNTRTIYENNAYRCFCKFGKIFIIGGASLIFQDILEMMINFVKSQLPQGYTTKDFKEKFKEVITGETLFHYITIFDSRFAPNYGKKYVIVKDEFCKKNPYWNGIDEKGRYVYCEKVFMNLKQALFGSILELAKVYGWNFDSPEEAVKQLNLHFIGHYLSCGSRRVLKPWIHYGSLCYKDCDGLEGSKLSPSGSVYLSEGGESLIIEHKSGGIRGCNLCFYGKKLIIDLGYSNIDDLFNADFNALQKLEIKYLSLVKAMEKKQFSKLGELKTLEFLDLSKNDISDIPSIVVKMKNLKHLAMAECKLLALNGINDMNKLETLNIAKNDDYFIDLTSVLNATNDNGYMLEIPNNEIAKIFERQNPEDFNNFKGLNGTYIYARKTKFINGKAHNLYLRNIRGIITDNYYYFNDITHISTVNETSDFVIDHLLNNINDNLEYFEVYIIYKNDDDFITKLNKIINIVRIQPNIKHINIYVYYGWSNKEHMSKLLFKTITINKFFDAIGEKSNQIKSFVLRTGNRTYLELVDDGDWESYTSFLRNLHLDFYEFNGRFDVYSSSQDKRKERFREMVDCLNNIKYYNFSEYDRHYDIQPKSIDFDYYKYIKTGDFVHRTSVIIEKDVILSKKSSNDDWLPPKASSYPQWLYYSSRGNIINGYNFSKYKYQRPDDEWKSRLSIE